MTSTLKMMSTRSSENSTIALKRSTKLRFTNKTAMAVPLN
ncbi:unnamed protein product [Cylicostephanus goldi]|uniref:Uncharacterized protein n=1 Tax=Cylicostephanus goldi TaxID=71465 RepID=A0A3P6UZM3_CYLGO|nr:unnamed protein product [Cylicostephanus goldi]